MAATNTQFSIAVHLLAGLGASPEYKSSSAVLAGSVNATPSFVRRILSKLAKAGLVRTTTGKAGACVLTRKPAKITLLEIFQAVQSPKPFAIHEYPVHKACPVSCGIKPSLENVLGKTTRAVETSLRSTSLAEVIRGL